MCLWCVCFFFFKQKTAYEMRISDWSSDVCSSDLLDDESKAWLTERGYDKMYGARPMSRLIQEKIKQPLAEELLFGKLLHGGEVDVTVKDGQLAFQQIGRASCRERVCQYVSISVVAVSLKQKITVTQIVTQLTLTYKNHTT